MFMRKKSIITALIALAITLTLSACGGAEPTAAETAAASETAATTAAETKAERTTEAEVKAETTAAATETAAPETTEAEIATATEGIVYPAVTIQDYAGIAMVEIIELETDTEELSPAMVEMNIDISDNVIKRYEDSLEMFNASGEDAESYRGGIDINAYSFTDENYIQVYNTILNTPTYGTTGDLFGFVYDIKNDNYITLGEYCSSVGVTEYDLMNEIADIAHEKYPDDYIGEISVKAFNLSKGPDGNYVTSYLFEMETIAPEAGEPYKHFFLYTPYDNDIMEMNGTQLFDPSSVDAYDPPIRSQEGFSYDEIAMG
jgi:hypothetical protein